MNGQGIPKKRSGVGEGAASEDSFKWGSSEQESATGTEVARGEVRYKEVREIRGGEIMKGFVSEEANFEGNALTDG